MNIRQAALALCLSLAVLPLHAQETTLRYRATHGERSYPLEYRIKEAAGSVELTATGDGTTDTIRWRGDTGTLAWRETTPADGTDISGERAGNTVKLSGTLKGRQVSRELRVDAAPWYQVFGPLMAELLPAGSQQREFWVMNPEDFSAHKMQARRAGTERITAGGAAVDAEKIHVSPAGALAPFWGADFWFRPSDGTYIYSRLPEHGALTVATIEGPGN
jgi:hypothetical protein